MPLTLHDHILVETRPDGTFNVYVTVPVAGNVAAADLQKTIDYLALQSRSTTPVGLPGLSATTGVAVTTKGLPESEMTPEAQKVIGVGKSIPGTPLHSGDPRVFGMAYPKDEYTRNDARAHAESVFGQEVIKEVSAGYDKIREGHWLFRARKASLFERTRSGEAKLYSIDAERDSKIVVATPTNKRLKKKILSADKLAKALAK